MNSNISRERALLIGVAKSSKERWTKIDSLEELAALTLTAGGEVVEKIIQIRPKPNPAFFLGEGKIQEIKELCREHKIELLIFDDPLTPSQIRNIENATGVRTIDRTTLILDIFAQHAKTAESKIQVELAQLDYRSTMLTGFGVELSRLGGGIGTRGPGEKKLEVDRRRIRERIAVLKRNLTRIDKERLVQRKQRDTLFKIALVGYTNAGKSTLMNRLTNASVKVASYLFSTLDPNTKIVSLRQNLRAFLTDTVGFIKNLPHQLVASFRATLSEIKEADLLLHIVDASVEEIEPKITAVKETLKAIGAIDKPAILVFNKVDRVFEPEIIERLNRTYPNSVFLSSLTGEGVEELKQRVADFIEQRLVTKTFLIPEGRLDLIAKLYEAGAVLERTEKDGKVKLRVKGYPAVLLRTKKIIEGKTRSVRRVKQGEPLNSPRSSNPKNREFEGQSPSN
jgi:GTP-binding protein HflX|uniref:GTPase HflX n=1 Tax=candidate division WOR-3 bacterium TaxID=2052148 RepID=A0A7C6EFX3_UNCW3